MALFGAGWIPAQGRDDGGDEGKAAGRRRTMAPARRGVDETGKHPFRTQPVTPALCRGPPGGTPYRR